MSLQLAEPTRAFLEHYSADPSHAVLLSGPRGVGLKTLALHMAQTNGRVLDIIEPIAKTAKGQVIISVERVRELYDETRTMLDGRHFVVIDDADRMNQPAQNALLKLLEEPNQSVHFILTTHAPDVLLPTIRSRTWQFAVPSIDEMSSHRLVKGLGITDETKRTQLLYVASGLPAELSRLSVAGDFDKLLSDVRRARLFIEGTSYQRLIVANELKEDREVALRFIDTVIMLLRRTVPMSADARSTLRLIDSLLEAYMAIKANGNVRLQLAAAVV